MAGRGKEWIEGESEGVFEHGGDDSFEDWTVDLEAGVVVDFDEPRLPVPVDHEVEAEELEVVVVPAMVEYEVVGPDDVCGHLLHPAEDVAFEVVALVGEVEVEVALELGIGQLIGGLVLLVVLTVLLNRVVGEVHELTEVFEVKLLAAGADVALPVPVRLQAAPHTRQQQVVPQVELAVVVQKRAVYVSLDDVGEGLSVLVLLATHALLNPAEGTQLDCLSPVCVLARLHDPESAGLPTVLGQKGLKFCAVPRSHVVGFGQEVEGVLECHVLVVEEQRSEEVFLGADGVVARQVVAHHVRREHLVEGDAKALAANVVLHQLRLLLAEDFPVQRNRLLTDLSQPLGRDEAWLLRPPALLAGEDLIELALRPVEADARLVNAARDLPPEPAFEDVPDEERVVALPDEHLVPGTRGGLLVPDVEVSVDAVGEVDLEEELQVVADLLAVADVTLVDAQLEAHLLLQRLRGLGTAPVEGLAGRHPAGQLKLRLLSGQGFVEDCTAADDGVGSHEGVAGVLFHAVGCLVARVALHLQQRLLKLPGAVLVPQLAAVELLMQFASQAQELVLQVELAAKLAHVPRFLRLLLVAPQYILYALHYDRELLVLLPALALVASYFFLQHAEALLADAACEVLLLLFGPDFLAGVVEQFGVSFFFFVAVAAVALLVACGELASVLVDVAR